MEITILVTGGAGYIGSQICKLLSQKGFFPITYDNLSTGNKEAVKWGPLVKGDLLDLSKLVKTIKKYKPKAVMHLAAHALVFESVLNPQKYYENNVLGSINLLNAMLKNNIKNFIFSSSCSTYGHPQFCPINEEHPQMPISPYGKTKYIIEQILQDYKIYGLNYVSLRYFNAAGADLDMEIGEAREEETHIIPLAIDAVIKDQTLNVYGTDFETKDGTAIRDYIHVQDIATAHLKALEYLDKEKSSLLVNLGSENGFSVLEVIKEIENLTNKKLKLQFCPRRKGDPAVLFANASLAKKVLNWAPEFSDLQTIINTAYKWHQKKKIF